MISGHRLGFLAAGLATFIAFPAFAQSTALIVEGAVAEGTTPAAPVKPLDILDTDYPLESLLANEEGKIQLNLIVNARGQVTAARVLTPTKLTRLEQQAANVARTRWQFTPAMRDGEGVAAQVNVDVDWKLPLEPVYEYQMLAEDLPPKGARVDFKPAVPTTSHSLSEVDYPSGAIITGRSGVVIFRFLVQEDGAVGDVKVVHSAFPSLDQAAIKAVKERWKFAPATLNGNPIPTWQYGKFIFQLGRQRFGDLICTSEPNLTSYGTDDSSYTYRVAQDGSIADIIVGTHYRGN